MPKNSLDRLRYLVLLKNDATARELGVPQKNVSPSKNELKERDYYYCYIFHNTEEPKGWRNDGFRSSWDCKSHWSYPMKGKLRRKIDKIAIDTGKELHRWATQLNLTNRVSNAADPVNAAGVVQNVPTLVEYFIKSKNKQLPVARSPFGTNANIDMQLINKLVAELEPKKPEIKTSSLMDPNNNFDGLMHIAASADPIHIANTSNSLNSNMLALLNYEATKQLSLDHHEDHPLLIEPTHHQQLQLQQLQLQQQKQAIPNLNLDYLYTPSFDYTGNTSLASLPVGYRGLDTTPSSTSAPPSISPVDWANWQQTLHSWAIYLDQLPAQHKAIVWNHCRNNPQFPPYSADSFVELWHLWSQSFHQHAPAISIFCSALDHFKEILLIARNLPNLQPPHGAATGFSSPPQTQAGTAQNQSQGTATYQSNGAGSFDLDSNAKQQPEKRVALVM